MTTELKDNLSKAELEELYRILEEKGIVKVSIDENDVKSYYGKSVILYLLKELDILKTKMNELIETINDHENRIKKLEEGGLAKW